MRPARLTFLALATFAAAGPAAAAATPAAPEAADDGLLDRYSRMIFDFNAGFYRALDAGSRWLGIPSPAPDAVAAAQPRGGGGLGNVASNLVNEPVTVLSALVTGDAHVAWRAVQRFGINSSAGVLGWYDRASDWGLPPIHADVGLSLCRAGVGEGGYVMLPFIGPRTVRDAVADVVLVNAVLWTTAGALLGTGAGWQTFVVAETIEIAADVLATRQIDANAKALVFDDYEAMRRDYLEQRRRRCADSE
ncbi:MAG: MlaA family lipoprotein [Alphaproteobacteria bacterium]